MATESSHSRRGASLRKIRADVEEGRRESAKALRAWFARLKLDPEHLRQHVGMLYDNDFQLLLEAALPKSRRGKGRPEMLSGFHEWIAVHALLLRATGQRNASKTVQQKWQISRAAVEHAQRRYGAKAREIMASVGFPQGREVLQGTIDDLAHAFIALGWTAVRKSYKSG